MWGVGDVEERMVVEVVIVSVPRRWDYVIEVIQPVWVYC